MSAVDPRGCPSVHLGRFRPSAWPRGTRNDRLVFSGDDPIEHLDHDPVCQCPCHKDEAPTADWWAQQHGCGDFFGCQRCIDRMRDSFALFPVVVCGVCRRDFDSFESCVTKLVSLRK